MIGSARAGARVSGTDARNLVAQWLAIACIHATLCAFLVWGFAGIAAASPEAVQFTSADAQRTKLSGRLLKPKGAGPFSAVVMLHGCSGMWTRSGKLKKRPAFWSKWFVRQGYLVLLADSFRPRGLGSICKIRNRPVKPDRERPYDIYGALRYLQSRPDVKPDRIALMGWSNGAMSMLWAIQDGARARPANLPYDFRAAIGFYPGCVKLAKTAYATSIPVLLQLGGADDWTRPGPCLELVARANGRGANMRADVHPGAYHSFDHPTSKARVITTRNSVYKTGSKRVHAGRNSKARAAAIANVDAYLSHMLKPESSR